MRREEQFTVSMVVKSTDQGTVTREMLKDILTSVLEDLQFEVSLSETGSIEWWTISQLEAC